MREKPESVADFKARIAIIMREREGRGKFSIMGAAQADPCVVRKQKIEYTDPSRTDGWCHK